MRAPLIPDVAFVELPPMKSGRMSETSSSRSLMSKLTVLVKENNISTGQVDGVSSAQAGHCIVFVSDRTIAV